RCSVDNWEIQAQYGAVPAYADIARRSTRPGPQTVIGRIASTRQMVQVADLAASRGYAERDPLVVAAVEIGGVRSILGVPLFKEDALIGAIVLYRDEVRPFTDKQIELVKNFAAQAVIAIENTRLLGDLRQRTDDLSESLEQQTATSEVLSVISGSVIDAQPVFEIIAKSAARLCNAQFCHVFRFDGQLIHLAATHGYTGEALDASRRMYPIPPSRDSAAARAILSSVVEQIPDVQADLEYTHGGAARVMNFRSIVAVPMLQAGRPIGAIAVSRPEVGYFPERQIELLETFADQAVIAIENARLFDEVQARTRELSESLEQQTATSEVLKVISSSTSELQPVFQAILENAIRICEAKFGHIVLLEGNLFRMAVQVNMPPKLAEYFSQRGAFEATLGSHLDRVMRTKQVSHTADDTAEAVQGIAAKYGGARSIIAVPMLKDDVLIGAIMIYRQEVRPFTDKQIELVKNFASQAVIAIEN